MCLLSSYTQFDHRETRKRLQAANLYKEGPIKIIDYLTELIDRSQTTTIGDETHPRGATIFVSQDRIAEETDMSRETVNRWLKKLFDAKILRSERGGQYSKGSLRYVFCQFDEEAKQQREALKQQKKEVQEPCDTRASQDSGRDSGVTPDKNPVTPLQEPCDTQASHNPEGPEFNPEAPPTFLGTSTGIEPTTPTDQGREEAYNTNLSPEPEPPPATSPDTDGTEKPKTSQKENHAPFFLSEAFNLADKFAGDELEFTDDELRRKRAHRFRDILAKLFYAPSAAERFPDPDICLQSCAEVVRLWIDIVKSRDNPAESVGFISTEPGMKALTQARKQVFGSADEHREIELDPAIQQMWREKHGDNWREKRQRELTARTT